MNLDAHSFLSFIFMLGSGRHGKVWYNTVLVGNIFRRVEEQTNASKRDSTRTLDTAKDVCRRRRGRRRG